MAAASSPLASAALDGIAIFKPGQFANCASIESEWSSGVRTPPPNGARTTIGVVKRPSDR